MVKKGLIELIVAIAIVTLLISNYYSYKEQAVSNDIIQCVDIQVKVLDVRADLNEYLNRYSISEDIIKNQSTNFNQTTLEWIFGKDVNTQRFFDEMTNLNLMRPKWEDCSMSLFSSINKRRTYSLVSSIFFWTTLGLNILVIYLFIKREKMLSKQS
jgi:hypothetical protein